MKSNKRLTLNDIQQIGVAVLLRQLGTPGTILFLQTLEPVSGDYSQERSLWLKEQNVEEIVQRIQQR